MKFCSDWRWLRVAVWLSAWAWAPSARAEPVEAFVLWGLYGKWGGHIDVQQGRFVKVQPFSFEPQYGDKFNGFDAARASWSSGVGGQFDGIHFVADADADTVLRLTTPYGETRLKPADFPADRERVVKLKGDRCFLVIGRGDPAAGPKSPPVAFEMPRLYKSPKPARPIGLPDGWWRRKETLRIKLSETPDGKIRVRRASNKDGWLYWLVDVEEGALKGAADVSYGGDLLAKARLAGALWLKLEPRWGRLAVHVEWPGGKQNLNPPTTLVETRGPALLVNREPFLVKGTLPRGLDDADAAWLKALGANTLRTRHALPQFEKFGFMAIGMVGRGPGHICRKPLSKREFLDKLTIYLRRVVASTPMLADSPCWLLAQLANEQAFAHDRWSGRYGHNPYGRLDYLLARCYNAVKPVCPMIPTTYSNCALSYRTPDFIECYAHNSYLSKDRGWPPIEEFMRWQGCDRRPFVMTEWGANKYQPEAYLGAPNLPVFEKIHAWNYPNRWRTFTSAGVAGGTNYCLYDYDPAKAKKQIGNDYDKGYSKFGVMTFDRKPKLAIWELWHIWRDFEIEPAADGLCIRFIRGYWARDCKLTLAGRVMAIPDFAPHSKRIVRVPGGAPKRFAWRIDYTTHAGLPMAATGGWPRQVEVDSFMERLKTRSSFKFLRELFDAEVLTADGRRVATLAEMTRKDGVAVVAFRKPNGVTYVTAFSRRRPNQGYYHDGVTADVAFKGKVVRVNELTGEPIPAPVDYEPTTNGTRLKNLRVPYIAKSYGHRAPVKIEVPVYRITPKRVDALAPLGRAAGPEAAARPPAHAAPVAPGIKADFFVAPNGDDRWLGHLATPNAVHTDGPFRTIARARDAVRETKGRAGKVGPFTVLIRGGTYRLRKTLVFGPQDSGAPDAPITFAAYPGEKPIISGGRVVRGWRPGEGPLWHARIAEVAEGRWYPGQLFVNGQRRRRARIPNEGFLRSDGPPRFSREAREAITRQAKIGRVRSAPSRFLGKFGMRYKPGDVRRWRDLDDVTIHVMHAWTSAVHWIAELDEPRRTIRFTGPSRFPASHFERQMPYYVENVREGLDAPGEWYVDRKTGVVSYWPMPGDDMRRAIVVVSALKRLVRFEGIARAGLFVEEITFRGLSFQHADWGPLDQTAENDGFGGVHFLDAAVMAYGARHCVFERCEFAHIGGYAIYLIDGSSHNRVEQCDIHDMGAGGILIGSRWSPYDTFKHALPADDAPLDEVGHHNVVDNCFIHGGGRIFYGVVGVFIAHSPYNTVTHNEICNMPYTAIVVGRRLDYKYSHAHHNTVAYNHLHHLGNGVMSDMAGIYTEGVSPGTRLHHNLIHDVNHYRYGAWGLYCDHASSFVALDHNICYDCMAGAYMQNVGQDNVVRNNIFVAGSDVGQVCDGKRKSDRIPPDSMRIERNIICTPNGQVLGHHWDKDDAFQFDDNLYWKPPGVELKFKDWSWEQWRGMGQDPHSIIADPMFVDAAKNDFRLRPGSPATKVGFEPFDLSEAGLYGEPEWVAAAKTLTFLPFEAMPPPPPGRIDDDFEAMLPGDHADGAQTIGETKTLSIRVTDETAASGRLSLKFTDGPNPQKPHWPYLVYRPRVSGATTRLSFDLRVEKGSRVWHEWRTGGSPYKIGPSIRIDDGVVLVAGRKLASLRLGKWVHMEIVAPIGRGDGGVFSLAIRMPDGKPQRFANLPMRAEAAFDELRWIGFISLADKEAVFYIDNVRLEATSERD